MTYKDTPERKKSWNVSNTSNRRAIKYGLAGRLRRRDIRRLFQLYPCCLKCGSTQKLSIDHIKPLSLGGPNDFSNIQVLCFHCNRVKGLKTVDYRPRQKAG